MQLKSISNYGVFILIDFHSIVKFPFIKSLARLRRAGRAGRAAEFNLT
jgi:hypothetical protein